MRRLIILTILLLSKYSLCAQPDDSSVVSYNEIKEFLEGIRPLIMKGTKFILSEKNEYHKAKEILQNISQSDTGLTNKDIEYMMNQIDKMKDTIWNSKFIGKAIFIKAERIDSIFQNLKKNGGWKLFRKNHGSDFYKMSIPCFSKDKQTAFIYIEYYCGGLCGEGGFKIFKRQNNK